jgi:AcrR family transcriptional regulator
MTRRRAGRRPGGHDTRADILAAAREIFAERGYDGASVRRIATSAGVDPALVHHYFGTKEKLFRATVEAPIDPAVVLPQILAGGVDGLGERMLRTFLGVWEHPETGPAMRATVRSVVASELSALLLREFFATQIVRRVIGELDLEGTPEEKALRASLVASQLFGVALARYIIRFEPLASVPNDTIVAVVGPTIQRYLTAPLP